MPVHRCPRCRAQDISADAHPTRVLRGNDAVGAFVCRGCYRAAELEFRIACDARGVPYAPLPIREGLRRLAALYRERIAEADGRASPGEEPPDASAPIRAALAEVERRLALAAVE